MKRKLFLLVYAFLLWVIVHPTTAAVYAQDCTNVNFTYTTSESRCMATGAIAVSVTGGSGNYNYKVVGPVSTNFTSSPTISGLPSGTYTIIVRDINRGCQVEKTGVVITGSYQDPRFQLSNTNVSCAGNDGTVTVNSQQYGRSPFTYSIIAPSPFGVGTTNTTGQFTNLRPGEYAIQLTDSCGGIQVRRITVENYTWWFDGVTVTKTDCDYADAAVILRDNKGNINTSAAFAGFTYGVVNTPGDTTWVNSRNFRFLLNKKRSATFVAKDPCGTLHSHVWNEPANVKPTVGDIATSNLTCSGFTASVTGQLNLTSPVYTLVNSNNAVISSNTTGTFTNIPYGSYCINTRDACYDTTINKCFTVNQAVASLDATPLISNQTCTTFTATLGGTNLTAPQYCLYDSVGTLIGCNATGTFNNVPYGSYCYKVKDDCSNTVLEKCFKAYKPLMFLTGYSLTGQSCTKFNVAVSGNNGINPRYCLFDTNGNVVACNNDGVFTDIANGSYCIRAISCGDTTNALCFSSGAPAPTLGPVVTYNKTCSTFAAHITGFTNITNPTFNLYNSNDVLIASNTTSVFENLPYGTYCLKVKDGCRDTTIDRCFTEKAPVPAVNSNIDVINRTCSTFTARITGQQNLTAPTYILYDANNVEIAQNGTGSFSNLPYGKYCIAVKNSCYDTTITRCREVTNNYAMALSTTKACAINMANIDVAFTNGVAPYTVRVYHPDGTLVQTVTGNSTPVRVTVPSLAAGLQYTVTGADACGRTDTKTVIPDAMLVTKSISIRPKCPSSTWQNGSGDVVASYTSNYFDVMAVIIKKDGATFNRSHSSQSGTSFTFSDLEPATYIMEYTLQTCNTKFYDTFMLKPYSYPTQGMSTVYQCDNSSFSLGADINGGVNPYKYQIIGSLPETPSIHSAEQSSPIFNINTGTNYSLVRLRSVDACGNATLSDVSVLPLQNIVMKASNDCFYKNVVLSVDTIPNADYKWYKRTGINDSILLTTDITYNLPFMRPEDVGTYICKVTVNNSCITRIASYTLDGDCGYIHLPVALQLKGTKTGQSNVLSWQTSGAEDVAAYTVERKTVTDTSYTTIGYLTGAAATAKDNKFTDNKPADGNNLYRIKSTSKTGAVVYSNTVALKQGTNTISVYPNPVQNEITVSVASSQVSQYIIELHNAGGQTVYKNEIKNSTASQLRITRNSHYKPGMYLLKVTNTTTGITEHYKLLFQ